MGRRRRGGPRSRPDGWSERAKAQGYAARSVFKLTELDRRFQLLRPGDRVLDLGCHPGSWLKYAAERVGPSGFVLGIDRNATDAPWPHVKTLTGDIFEVGGLEEAPFQVVLSDMAPDTTGHRTTDQARSAALVEMALSMAHEHLADDGRFVAKVFQGPDVQGLIQQAKAEFQSARLARPQAIRKESTEIYIVGLGRRARSKS